MTSGFGLDRDARADAVRRIRAYFERERAEELGEMAAGFILDFVAEELGPLFYNAALRDAQALLARSADSLDADIEAQRREPPRPQPREGRRVTREPEARHRPPEIRTARLRLRPFEEEDVDAFAAFVGDPAYLHYLGPEHPGVREFVTHNLLADPEREPGWVVCRDGDVVGSAFLGIDVTSSSAEMAVLLAPSAWRRGVATEACRALVAWAFTERGIAKIVARADARNQASIHLLERLGLRREGTLRSQRPDREGHHAHEVMFGLLREDWQRRTGPAEPPPPHD